MIDKKLIKFLKGIANHNDKEWYEEHKDEYKKLRTDFILQIESLRDEIAKFDPAIAKAVRLGKPTAKVYRIHRDARFSKNKGKYKTNISGFISADVKSDSEPAYYLSIEPGGRSFVGGGLFMPERMVLSEIRDKIEEKPKALNKIENDPRFKTVFPTGINREKALKTAPRGHDPEHKAIEYLRLKSFTAGNTIPDSQLSDASLEAELIDLFRTLSPLNSFLRVHLPQKADHILTQF
jgi:uncharacterized protein (TIGR02453 family)